MKFIEAILAVSMSKSSTSNMHTLTKRRGGGREGGEKEKGRDEHVQLLQQAKFLLLNQIP